MIVVSVMYPHQDGARFDWDYYLSVHLPLVRDAFGATGMASANALKGLPAADGSPPPFTAIAMLRFPDMAAVAATMGGPRAAEVMADLKNFTDMTPMRQVSEFL